MESPALVSVIVPCYNGAAFLNQALDSILAQTYRPLDIIVLDDGSTDHSATIAHAFTRTYPEVRYAYQEHAGLGAALNHGIALAQGDFFSFLDADDRWTKNKTSQQLALLQAAPQLDMVFGYFTQFNQAQAHSGAAQEGYSKGTLLIRRASFFRVGLFATEYRVGDFIDWYIRAQELALTSKMLTDVFLERRIHTDNMGTRERDHRKAYLQILKKSLERRQQQK